MERVSGDGCKLMVLVLVVMYAPLLLRYLLHLNPRDKD